MCRLLMSQIIFSAPFWWLRRFDDGFAYAFEPLKHTGYAWGVFHKKIFNTFVTPRVSFYSQKIATFSRWFWTFLNNKKSLCWLLIPQIISSAPFWWMQRFDYGFEYTFEPLKHTGYAWGVFQKKISNALVTPSVAFYS